MKKEYDEISKLPRSDYVEINEKDNNIWIKINKPTENMQTDMADFEALAIMCKCIKPIVNVTIQFENYNGWHRMFGNLNSESSAYLRFLYRVITFKEAFPDWVEISDENKEEVDYFKSLLNDALKEGKVSNNIPDKKAEFNPNGKEEQVIERKLACTKEGKEYLKQKYINLYSDNDLLFVNNQLPNGLFNIKPQEIPHESNRIFTSGAYDIWGIDKKGNFCIFELKKDKGNIQLGVISELFFYAVYAHKILCNSNLIHEKRKRINLRGYEKLYDAVQANEIKGVNAIFLLGSDVHKAIDERRQELKDIMDTNKFGIKFNFITYDIDIINKISTDELL